MKKHTIFPLVAAGIVAASGCKQQTDQGYIDLHVPAIDLSNLDTTVAPGEDFYQFATGGWIAKNPLKPEYARYGSFDQLRETNEEKLRVLVESLSHHKSNKEAVANKIGTLYSLGMDSVKLNQDGKQPILEEFASINRITTKDELSLKVAQMHKEGIFPYFALFVDADEKNSNMNIVQLYQSGIGMGDRDYYLLEDAETKEMREAYTEYIGKLFRLMDYSGHEVEEIAAAILDIETRIAKVSYSREDLRDSEKNYNKVPLGEFKAQSEFINWDIYFKELGLENQKEIDPKQYYMYEGLHNQLKDISIEDQKYYLLFNLLSSAAPYLSDDFVTANFDFYGKTMSGKEEQQPRWKRALATTNGALSEAVGQMYVERYFPESSKDRMLEMVHNLEKALSERIDNLEWMSNQTKKKAQEKLETFIVKIGYPDKWKDYSDLKIKTDSYWENVRRARIFEMREQLAEAGKPVDKDKWYMSPQTVNAYYNPTTNEICFPAAILQPPFFNPDADDAVNYGGIGVVIGHEMTHGFDDQGRKYDKNGNLTDWWTEEDAVRFVKLADVLVQQYDDIVVVDDLHANGRFTLGENIADQGGLLVSYQAYKNSLKHKEKPAPIDGFTDDQRFYLGYAALWGQNIRPEEIRRLTKMDPHSLGKWRVNAAVRNIDAFYEAFDIKESDPMYLAPSERVVIW